MSEKYIKVNIKLEYILTKHLLLEIEIKYYFNLYINLKLLVHSSKQIL